MILATLQYTPIGSILLMFECFIINHCFSKKTREKSSSASSHYTYQYRKPSLFFSKMEVASTSWSPSMALALSTGNFPCSTVPWKGNSLIVVRGYGNKYVGDVLSSTYYPKKTIPKCSSGNSPASKALLLDDRYLYVVFEAYNREELHVADMDQLENTVALFVNFFFSNFWKKVAVMQARHSALATHGGKIYAVGGFLRSKGWITANEVATKGVRQLDTTQIPSGWGLFPDMIYARRDLATVIVGDLLYAIGGKDAAGKSLASVECIDLSNPAASWQERTPMTRHRDNFAATVVSGSVIVVAGGYNERSKRLKSVEYFDTMNSRAGWTALPDLSEPRSHFALSVFESNLVVAGGYTGFGLIPLDTVETIPIKDSRTDDEISQAALASLLPVTTGLESNDVPYATAVVLEPLLPGYHKEAATASQVYEVLPPLQPMQPSAPPSELDHSRSNVSSEKDRSCVVCLERPKQVAFLCGHQACLECSPLFQECPTCRLPIQGRIQLFD